MIRDPSDGSVRDEISADANEINSITRKTLSEEINGLPPGSEKQRNIERLEKSRQWLKEYLANRGR